MKSLAFCLFLSLAFLNTAVADEIVWGIPVTITSVADISNLGGPIHLAADFNPPEAFNPDGDLLFIQGDFDGVINGIQFTGVDEDIAGLLETNFVGFTGSDLGGDPRFPTGAANASTFLGGSGGRFYRGFPTEDVDLDNLLDSHAFRRVDGFGQLTIEGLNIGKNYQVQLIAIADGRPAAGNAIVRVGNGAGVLSGPTLARPLYQAVAGRFTADSTFQTILIEPIDSGGPGLSGIVVQAVPETEVLLGDVNQDGVVDFLDIAGFISILSAGDYLAEADTNQDGVVDFLDISPFVALLSS